MISSDHKQLIKPGKEVVYKHTTLMILSNWEIKI